MALSKTQKKEILELTYEYIDSGNEEFLCIAIGKSIRKLGLDKQSVSYIDTTKNIYPEIYTKIFDINDKVDDRLKYYNGNLLSVWTLKECDIKSISESEKILAEIRKKFLLRELKRLENE